MSTKTHFMIAAAVALAMTGTASAQNPPNPPSPFELVSQLDFECRPAIGQPPVPQVFIRQLNPVLVNRLPNQVAMLGQLEDVCVPVAKNNQIPSPRALGIAEWADLACYAATAPPVDLDVKLSHLNPVLAGLPDEDVKLVQLKQLCVPVRKNNSQIPPAIKEIVSHLDVACYELEQPTSDANRVIGLSHLNPVIQAMQFDNRLVEMKRARRLCVPVGKNGQQIPPAVLALVRWADFLKYRIDVVQGFVPPLPLWLTHLNPLFAGVNPFFVVLDPEQFQLMVPVAKDHQIPPGGAAADGAGQ
jgi:hypothetical protein